MNLCGVSFHNSRTGWLILITFYVGNQNVEVVTTWTHWNCYGLWFSLWCCQYPQIMWPQVVGWSVNNELELDNLCLLEVLPWHLPGDTKESHRKPQLGCSSWNLNQGPSEYKSRALTTPTCSVRIVMLLVCFIICFPWWLSLNEIDLHINCCNVVFYFIAISILGMQKLLFLMSIIKKLLRVSWLWDLMTQILPRKRRILRRSVKLTGSLYNHCQFIRVVTSV